MTERNKKSSDRTFKGTVNSLWFILLFISVFSGGVIFYDYINNIIDLYIILAGPVFIVLSFFTILVPSYCKVIFLNRFFSNLLRWTIGLACAFSLILVYNFTRNSSTIIYSVKFFWEEGVNIEFRENNTFRACNSDMFSSSVSYGSYHRNNEKIILLDEIKFGMSKMNDTLIINNRGIDFTLEKRWRVSGGTLFYVNQR